MKLNNTWLTIPNVLSAYRLLSFPFLLWLCFSKQEQLFATLLIINLITDILDGLIARIFNQQTEIGARLDSIADIGSYILAIWGVTVFKSETLQDHVVSFGIFCGLYLFVILVLPPLRYKRFTSFHLYSSKITGYLQGALFAFWFAGYFTEWFYYLAIGFGIASLLEHLIIQFMFRKPPSDAKGLIWILSKKKVA